MKISNAAKGIYMALAFLVTLAACKKDTDLILTPEGLEVAAYLRLDSTINRTLDLSQTSKPVSIVVSGYGEPITKVTVYVSPTNSPNKATWRRIKEYTVDASQKATLSVTPAEIATALGLSSLPNGAQYVLYNEITTASGKTISIANMSSSFEPEPAYNMAMRWTVTAPCKYDQTVFTGDFTVITDTWQDFNPGEKVKVEPGPGANQITITAFPSPAYGTNRKGYVLDVNPSTSAVTGRSQVIGDYFPFSPGGAPFPDVTMTVTAGNVNSCNRTIDLTGVKFSIDGGTYRLTLRRL
jgi:hypothetical protein